MKICYNDRREGSGKRTEGIFMSLNWCKVRCTQVSARTTPAARLVREHEEEIDLETDTNRD